jgi:hypothetical protein
MAPGIGKVWIYSHHNPKVYGELGNKESKLLWYGKMRKGKKKCFYL